VSLDAGCSVAEIPFLSGNTGCLILDVGYLILIIGYWVLGIGYWLIVNG